MTKFRIVEVNRKKKIQEINLAKTGKLEAGTGLINSLAALGSAFGINTQALYTLTGMMGNIKSIINDTKKLFDIKQRSRGLGSNELKLVEVIRNKKLYDNIKDYVKSAIVFDKTPAPPTTMPEDEGTTEAPAEAAPADTSNLEKTIVDSLSAMGFTGYKAKDLKELARETVQANPTETDANKLVNAAIGIINARKKASGVK